MTSSTKRCRDCAGEGVIILYRGVEDGPMATVDTPCYECSGTGWTIFTEDMIALPHGFSWSRHEATGVYLVEHQDCGVIGECTTPLVAQNWPDDHECICQECGRTPAGHGGTDYFPCFTKEK